MSVGLGAVLATNLASSAMSLDAQQKANWENRQNAKDAMAFSERMSNTQYQRAAADMKAAGLNPLLAAGAGTTTPQGVTTNFAPEDLGQGLRNLSNSAQNTIRLKQELASADANIKLTEMAAQAKEAERENNAYSALQKQNELNKERDRFNSGVYRAENQAAIAEANAATLSAANAAEKAKYDKDYVKYDSGNRRVRETLGTINSAVDTIKPFRSGYSGHTVEDYDGSGEMIRARSTRYHK